MGLEGHNMEERVSINLCTHPPAHACGPSVCLFVHIKERFVAGGVA
jgi:hypothetical protein